LRLSCSVSNSFVLAVLRFVAAPVVSGFMPTTVP
jgi:hypothetical protein